MTVSLRVRFFLWLLALLGVFIVIQSLVYGAIEVVTTLRHPGMGLREQLMEVVIGVGLNVLLIPLLATVAWWISKRMLQPIRTLARTAGAIGGGHFDERVDVSSMPDDEMRSLANTLNRAFDRYADANDSLERFSADASHQLRTPLAAIRATAEVGLAQQRTGTEYREMLGSILENGARLSRMIEQLLSMARLDADTQEMTFAPFDLGEQTARIARLYRPTIEQLMIALEEAYEPKCSIRGNADLIGEVIRNLLDNAMRHVSPNGRIGLQVSRIGQDVRLIVMDTGPGVPPDQRQSIFKRFGQTRPAEATGTGLGLALASRIVRVHKGRLELVDRSDWGAVFSVTMPAA